MQIVDCLPVMTKSYLLRVVESLVKDDVPRGDEERLREQIRQNSEELADAVRIRRVLRDPATTRAHRILVDGILNALLNQPECRCSDEALFGGVHEFEAGIISQASTDDAFALTDAKSLEIYSAVLDVALDDGVLTEDEHRLLERLRRKLGVSRLQHRLLEARLDKFPKPGNSLHTHSEYSEALKQLQRSGILFYCNRADDGPTIVLPEELVSGVKKAIGFEMRPDAQRHMQDALTNSQLRGALAELGLPLSGSKAERSERLLQSGCKPSEVLNTISNAELGEICKKLPSVKVSGSKAERVQRIVSYFDSLTNKVPEQSEDSRAVFYQYFEEFASRDNQNLYQLGVISRDRDMEYGFEEGTRYLFETKFGHALRDMPGSDHADGSVVFPNGELLLWDNKGKEADYQFPKAHADQFKRYIRESAIRVTVFLVVVPTVGPDAKVRAMRLKHENPTDTDIAVITAVDLKWLAENWRKHSTGDRFNLQVLNTTGILDRATLVERLEIFGE